jgi:hypothetical protein
MKAILLMATCVVLALSVATSQAEIIAWDSFATSVGGYYPVGPIQNKNPSVGSDGFSGAWSAGTNAFCSQHGGLSHPLTPGTTHAGLLIAYTGDSWANRRLSRAIDYSPSDGTYYTSVLLQKKQPQNIDFMVGLAPLESYDWSFSNIQGTYVGIGDGNISFLTTSHLHHIVADTQVNIGETYFALMQFDYSTSGSDTVTATIYDGSSTEIGNYTKTNLNLDGDIGRIGLITSNFSPYVAVDEWRFGTELSDVMVLNEPNGDFDMDSDVDGADFLMWQRGESPNPLSQPDLTGWEDNYGTISGSMTTASTAIPEPSTCLMLLLGTMAMFFRRNVIVP